jgi:hypothetical protein
MEGQTGRKTEALTVVREESGRRKKALIMGGTSPEDGSVRRVEKFIASYYTTEAVSPYDGDQQHEGS